MQSKTSLKSNFYKNWKMLIKFYGKKTFYVPAGFIKIKPGGLKKMSNGS